MSAELAAAAALASFLADVHQRLIPLERAYEQAREARELGAEGLESCAADLEGAALAVPHLVLAAEGLARGGIALQGLIFELIGAVAERARAVGANVEAPPEGAADALLEDARLERARRMS